MGEDSRVSYDHQKVAKIEQKTGSKENVNHNSCQNSFGQLWLTCNHVGDSEWEPSGRSLVCCRTPMIGPRLTILKFFQEKLTYNAGLSTPNGLM